MIRSYASYTTPNSDLVVHVDKVYHISENGSYVKFRGLLTHKLYGYHYETKNYKLPIEVVNRWEIYDKK